MAKKNTGGRSARSSYDLHAHSLIGKTLKWGFVLCLWAGILGGLVIAWYAAELPSITKDVHFSPKSSITVKAADGSVIARYGETRGETLSVADLPLDLIHAVLATEDRRFYQHFGVDPVGMGRAVVSNLKAGRTVQGGSTITQQLAKNLFLSQDRTLKRKIQEALLALWLEHELTKDEILSAYLNRVYLGSGTYGVEAAAKLYFGKPVQKISLREAAMLAGLLKAPSRYSPLQNPENARARANIVLEAMADAGYITPKQAKKSEVAATEKGNGGGDVNAARYFADWIVDGLDDLIGTPQGDIIVETTLNPRIQKTAEDALKKVIAEHGKDRKVSQGAVISMRPDGAVVAMVGGVDYAQSQFNRAVQARRQPGSSFKPVVYLTALEKGYRPDTIVLDAPVTEGRYRPQNFDGKYLGEVRLDEALALSLNTVSYRLAKDIGPAAIVDTAKRLGIYSKLEPDLSLALGSSSLSPLELTTAYAAIASGGMAVYPYAIAKITGKDGTLYYERSGERPTRRVVDGYFINELVQMMRGVMAYGTGQGAQPGFPAAGKTGTSQDSRDAWFMGFSDELVTGVWIGNDDNSPTAKITGGSFPATIWKTVMVAARGQYPSIAPPADTSGGFQDLIGRLITPDMNGAPPPSPENQDGQPPVVFQQEPQAPQEQTPFRFFSAPPPQPYRQPMQPHQLPGTGDYND